ncbi:MAG: hypothetical protein M3Q75_01050 [Gemmatimonadota bacterium]|nr:hypothetical protein [Gemmatimonadota bacterium]
MSGISARDEARYLTEMAADAFDRFDATGNLAHVYLAVDLAERALDYDADNGNATALITAAEDALYV